MTLPEIASVLGIDEKTVRRDVEIIARKFADGGLALDLMTHAEARFFSSVLAAFLSGNVQIDRGCDPRESMPRRLRRRFQ